MKRLTASALIVDDGARVLLRLNGRIHEFTQRSLRELLGLPRGKPGLGITVDRDHIRFEFAADSQIVDLTIAQLRQRIANQSRGKAIRSGQRRRVAAHATI